MVLARLTHPLEMTRRIGTALIVPACLLFLVAGSVAWAINDPGLYRNGFDRYDTAVRSGITDADLDRIGGELRSYFNTGTEPLAVRAQIYGVEQDVFSAREIAHMYDVKRLVRGTYWVGIGSIMWIVALAAVGCISKRRQFVPTAARLAIWSGAITLASVLAVGLVSLASFQQLFLLFHQLSFANDLWMLNPHTDYLLILFPGGFWFDATMRVALTSILGAVLLLCVGAVVLWYRKWAATSRAASSAISVGSSGASQ